MDSTGCSSLSLLSFSLSTLSLSVPLPQAVLERASRRCCATGVGSIRDTITDPTWRIKRAVGIVVVVATVRRVGFRAQSAAWPLQLLLVVSSVAVPVVARLLVRIVVATNRTIQRLSATVAVAIRCSGTAPVAHTSGVAHEG